MTRTIVVGGGVGGLAVAIRVAAAGHEVLLVERNDVVGGKLATYTRDGYTFDIGPSLVTLPHLFDELFELAGSTSQRRSTWYASTRSSGTTGVMVRR